MPSKVRIQVRGRAELSKVLEDLAADLERHMAGSVLPHSSEPVLADAQFRAPVLTGRLRDSLRQEVSLASPPTLSIGSGLPYASVADRRTGFLTGRLAEKELAIAKGVETELERYLSRRLEGKA